GKPLVHSSQLAWLRGVAQARLAAAGLSGALTALRYFCRSLSLELLYTQTLRLCRDRLELGCELGYRLIIGAEAESLCVWHVPALAGGERVSAALTPHAPSMERLLAHTVHVRSRQRLNDLKVECSVGGWPCVLACSVVAPCLRAEQLLVSVGAHGGRLRARVPAYPATPRMPDLANALAATNIPLIKNLLTHLRYYKVAAGTTATTSNTSNSGSACSVALSFHLAGARRCTPDECEDEVTRGDSNTSNSGSACSVALSFHLAGARRCTPDECEDEVTRGDSNTSNSGSACSVALSFHLAGARRCTPDECEVEVTRGDSNTSNSGSTCSVALSFHLHSSSAGAPAGAARAYLRIHSLPGKRKMSLVNARAVRVRQPAYFLPELAHVVAAADERVPFLAQRGVTHGGVQPEWSGSALAMRVVALPLPAGAEPRAAIALRSRLLAATVRLTTKNQARVWTAEFVFHGSPVRTPNPKEQERESLWQGICIRSYTYRSLVVGFGGAQRATALLQWSAASHRYTLATPAHQPAANAHHMLHHHLDHYINCHKDLMSLGVVLRETYAPLLALSRLPTLPQLGLHHIRIIYAGAYSIEVGIRGGGIVTIRDGSYSKFDRSSVVDEFAPAQGLKAFLSKYVDDINARLLAEDDNPPSPMSPMPPGPQASSTSGSRVLVGGRAWAGATATPIPVSKLETLCTPCEPPLGAPPGPSLAPLQRFLACLTMVSVEATSLTFRCESAGLAARVALHPQHMQSLHLHLTPLPDHKDTWSTDDLQEFACIPEQDGDKVLEIVVLKICLTRGDTQLVLPLVYDMQLNVTQLADKQNAQPHLIACCVYDMQLNVTQLADKQNAQPHLIAVSLHLKR
ncbi:putative CRSP complex subunit, partial [Operophtera brumata]